MSRLTASQLEEQLSVISRTSRQNLEELYNTLTSNLSQVGSESFTEVDITDWSVTR